MLNNVYNYIIFSTERHKDKKLNLQCGRKEDESPIAVLNRGSIHSAATRSLALLLFIAFFLFFFFSFEFRPHQKVAATDERSGCSFSLSLAFLAVALASFKLLLLPCLSCMYASLSNIAFFPYALLCSCVGYCWSTEQIPSRSATRTYRVSLAGVMYMRARQRIARQIIHKGRRMREEENKTRSWKEIPEFNTRNIQFVSGSLLEIEY